MPRRKTEHSGGVTPIPCRKNEALRSVIARYADALREQAHTLGDHGLSKDDFYRSGVFRGAIERLRGQFSATMREKRDFVRCVLNHMQDAGAIGDWESAESKNRHDFLLHIGDRNCVIELKGCLDGNNTTIFERPPHAHEFVLWSICSNPAADPRHNAWSGLHVRLSAEIIERHQRIDGLIIWDWLCASSARPGCPKSDRLIDIGPWRLPPPCIYVFPATIAHPRNNPCAQARRLDDCALLSAFADVFSCNQDEIFYVSFEARYFGSDIERRTIVKRNGAIVAESDFTPIQRA